MTQHSHQTAPTQFVDAAGIRFGLPTLWQIGWRAAGFQPALHRHDGPLGPAGDRRPRGDAGGDPVQQRGHFHSSGEVPTTVEEMGANAIAFIKRWD